MSMADRDGLIWFDGEFVEWRDAKVHVLTHTLHYGMGVFEGVRAYETPKGTAIFRLQEHTNRFFDSAHIMYAAAVQQRGIQRSTEAGGQQEQAQIGLHAPDGILRL